jgi:hypothetical protein
MRETYGSRLKLNKIAISFLLAAILLLPVLPTGSGTDGEGMTAEGEEMTDSLFGTVDLSTEIMEQYIKGENEEDYLGYSIDKADLNLDGKDDLILGAPGYNLSSGAVLIFFGGSKQRIMDYDSADVMIDHNEIGSYFGLKVKTGDVTVMVFPMSWFQGIRIPTSRWRLGTYTQKPSCSSGGKNGLPI